MTHPEALPERGLDPADDVVLVVLVQFVVPRIEAVFSFDQSFASLVCIGRLSSDDELIAPGPGGSRIICGMHRTGKDCQQDHARQPFGAHCPLSGRSTLVDAPCRSYFRKSPPQALSSSPTGLSSASPTTPPTSMKLRRLVSLSLRRRCSCAAKPVPAGISRPTMTFSFRPRRSSFRPRTAASVSTRVVSWKDAAEMKDSVASEALVMPSNSADTVAG